MSDLLITVHAHGATEQVAATRLTVDLVIIDEHPVWAPFAPCDIVKVSNDTYMSTVQRAETYTFVAYFDTTVDDFIIEDAERTWASVGYATRIGDAEIMITSYSATWINEVVARHPAVLWIDVLQRPRVELETAVESGTEAGQ